MERKKKVQLTFTSPVWLSVRFSFSDIHLEKWKFNRRLWCKSQAIIQCGVKGRIKPSNPSCICLTACSIMPHLLDQPCTFRCEFAASKQSIPALRVSLEEDKLRESPTQSHQHREGREKLSEYIYLIEHRDNNLQDKLNIAPCEDWNYCGWNFFFG